jgi:RimJ/RimL family protein N-acetyltransferase
LASKPAAAPPTESAPSSLLAVPYPDDELRLRDGSPVKVRAIQPDDEKRLRAFHARLSPDSIIFRFFRVLPELSEEDAYRFTHLDYAQRMALVATTPTGCDEGEEVIRAVVRYERTEPGVAEVAFVVEDAWQGKGIATALLYRLAAYARTHGLTTFVAVTMTSNARMLDVFRHAGFPYTMRHDGSEISVTLDISSTESAPSWDMSAARLMS